MPANSISKWALKAGKPPGSLIHLGETSEMPTMLTLVKFPAGNLEITQNATVEQCKESLNSDHPTWLHVEGVHNIPIIEEIGKCYNLHPLALEDILSTSQQAKLDNYKNNIFIVLRYLSVTDDNGLQDQQFSIVLGSNYLLSFAEKPLPFTRNLFQRIDNVNSRIRKYGLDYLCYTLLDSIVDYHFIVLQRLDEKVDQLESELLHKAVPSTLQRIQHVKRDISLCYHAVWPLRDVVSQMIKIDCPFITEETKVYLHDVYDHILRAISTIESFREISMGMLDLYTSSNTRSLNEVISFLTVVSTIFVPLTFIASFYGMNFKYMPELDYRYSYLVVIAVMVVIAIAMIVYFRRKKWL